MAILKADAEFRFGPVVKLIGIFPELNGRFLSLIGKRSRVYLKMNLLSGQELDLRAFPTDKLGRPTIVSDVNKRRDSVKIYSYPVNLFERGRILRDGSKEAGRYIITRKLKQAVMSRQASYVNEFENRILQPEIKKAGL